jgi:hypothetical protein
MLWSSWWNTNRKIPGNLKQMAGRAPCYGHVKTFVYIDMDGEITADPRIERWHSHAVARAIATKGKSFLEGITDHLISNYIRGLEGKLHKKHTIVRRRVTANTARRQGKPPLGDAGRGSVVE